MDVSLTPSAYHEEPFTDDERAILDRFFTNTTGPVFAIVDLPEVVKGALFARYSRSPKSVRRLFLDEFHHDPDAGIGALAGRAGDDASVGRRRAEELYQKVFTEYGDDSVAQLGSVHLACEQASNVLTKVLEWGRIASYLEQSTRYIAYDQRLGDRYRYHRPAEIAASPLDAEYRSTIDGLFEVYASLTPQLTAYYETVFPRDPGDSTFVYRSAIRARVCDDLRGLLPAATTSNVGIHASGQAFEMLLIRMRAHPLAEVRAYADLMLAELRKVIPSFLKRVDVPDRGGDWSTYLSETRAATAAAAASVEAAPEERPEVELVDWDPDAELHLAAAALYAHTDLPDSQLLAAVGELPAEQRASIITAFIGDRRNRRHKPARALERIAYRFDILCDYGIFRDLQRHRMLTLEWQRLGTNHGYVTPDSILDIGAEAVWVGAMERAASLQAELAGLLGPDAAQYAVPFAYRVRFYMHLNAREAFHLLELRTAAGGHPGYRRVCQEMHRLIRDRAGHRVIAEAMKFVDHREDALSRLESERRAEARRAAAGITEPASADT